MSTSVPRVERRGSPRFVVFRDCWVAAHDTRAEVTLLNVSLSGVATLGPLLAVSPGERITLGIEGIATPLEAVVVNVHYGRIGAKFDLGPEAAASWREEFTAMVEGLSPM